MKKLILLFCAVTIGIGAFSQILTSPPEEEDDFKTIFDGQKIKISGFGGPFMRFGSIDGEFAHFMGGHGGILLNDFYVGGYGMGLTNHISGDKYNQDYTVEFGHGGLMTGINIFGKKAIHPNFYTLFGWGSATIKEDYEDDFDFYDNVIDDDESIFVIEPSLEIEMNFTRFFRVALGGSYRFVTGVDLVGYDDADFSGPSASLSFRFGWF